MRDARQQRSEIDVLDPAFDEVETRAVPVDGEVGFLQRSRIVIGEAIETSNLRSAVEKRRREMRANETATAGHEIGRYRAPLADLAIGREPMLAQPGWCSGLGRG